MWNEFSSVKLQNTVNLVKHLLQFHRYNFS